MARLIAIYSTPTDAAAFDAYYFQRHVPLAKTIPGLIKYEISRGDVMAPANSKGVHLVALLHFSSLAAINDALGSAEGKATAQDLANFATGGVDLLMMETQEI